MKKGLDVAVQPPNLPPCSSGQEYHLPGLLEDSCLHGVEVDAGRELLAAVILPVPGHLVLAGAVVSLHQTAHPRSHRVVDADGDIRGLGHSVADLGFRIEGVRIVLPQGMVKAGSLVSCTSCMWHWAQPSSTA